MKGRFNLLPHRSQMQVWQRRVLTRQASVVLLLAFLCALIVQGVFSLRVGYLDSYNATLRMYINQMAPDFRLSQQLLNQRDDMLAKQKTLERLDARRSTSVMILNDVANALPPDTYLTRLEEDGEHFRLEGRSVHNAAIAHFFELIVKSERLAGLSLEEIRTQDGENIAPYIFTIAGQVRLVGASSLDTPERRP